MTPPPHNRVVPDTPFLPKTINRLSVLCSVGCVVGLMMSMSERDAYGRNHIFSGVQRYVRRWFTITEEEAKMLRAERAWQENEAEQRARDRAN